MKGKNLFKKFLNLIFPDKCVGCEKKGEIVCEQCRSEIRSWPSKTESGVFVFFDYNQKIIKNLIWRLKYRGSKEVSHILTPLLYDNLLETISDIKQLSYSEQKTLIVPVPLHRKKQRQRGFNQAELIARSLIDLDPENFELGADVLVRKVNTEAQAKIKKLPDRLKNVRGAFAINKKEKLEKRLVIILDDVTTTGATLNECQKILDQNSTGRNLKIALASRDKMW